MYVPTIITRGNWNLPLIWCSGMGVRNKTQGKEASCSSITKDPIGYGFNTINLEAFKWYMYDFKDLVIWAKDHGIFGSEALQVENPSDPANRNVLLKSEYRVDLPNMQSTQSTVTLYYPADSTECKTGLLIKNKPAPTTKETVATGSTQEIMANPKAKQMVFG